MERHSSSNQTVLWVIAFLMGVIATVLVLRLDEPNAAYAQNARVGAAGIFAFSGQMSPGTFGVWMVNVDSGTIWAYELAGGNPKKLRLVAARSFLSDRLLEEFNAETPKPHEVEALVEEQRSRQKAKGQTGS
jgi:hypothetical protein